MKEKIRGWKLLQRSVKQLNTYGNGIGVLVTREAKAIGLKSGSKVQVSAIEKDGKKTIYIEELPEQLETHEEA
ncbi:hypothetical protein GW932_00685 [archaeon]|nr:hypothetical protein [archaeon]